VSRALRYDATNPELRSMLVVTVTAAGLGCRRGAVVVMGAGMSNVVLLLEQEPLIFDLVGKVLTDSGCQVVVCNSFEHLMCVADDWTGAVAVADFWGESDGALDEEECAQVMQLARAVPTILLAGRTWAGEPLARQLGLVALLQKPFDLTALCVIVTQTLGEGMRASMP
jgi:DNA-binding NtrC family response regulator